MSRPLIGVTVSRKSGWRIFPLMWLGVFLAGGKAVRWQNAEDVDIALVDGVVIGGGDDIAPMLYDGAVKAGARFDDDRDAMEKSIVERCLEEHMPVLGVCRGSQMINIVLGGTLDQDAYTTYGSRRYRTILPRKTVRVEPETRLMRIAGGDPMRVNALHSQAVDKLGDKLRVAARDDGGMVQAIERVDDPFMLGVQWHPEHLFYARRQRALFRALVTAAAAYAESRDQLASVDAVTA